ncbi:hypothetical protein HDU91_005778 [Kappamyces sp. JEL0680]|nr:hypothetical protein HDU91_005778 [Kappamyces sp. JEL0680]
MGASEIERQDSVADSVESNNYSVEFEDASMEDIRTSRSAPPRQPTKFVPKRLPDSEEDEIEELLGDSSKPHSTPNVHHIGSDKRYTYDNGQPESGVGSRSSLAENGEHSDRGKAKSGNSVDPISDGRTKRSVASFDQELSMQQASLSEWPSQDTASEKQTRAKVRMAPLEAEDEADYRTKKTRARGKSEAGAKAKKAAQNRGVAIEALDLENMVDYDRIQTKKSARNHSVDIERTEINRSDPDFEKQKPRKGKKGRVNPESDSDSSNDRDDENSASKPKSKMKKTASPPQGQSTSASAQPAYPPQHPMMMYGYRQEPFTYPQQSFHPGFMPPDYMIQPPVWNPNSAVNPQWMPVMAPPPNFGYQYFTSAEKEIPALAASKTPSQPAPSQDESDLPPLAPKPPSSSPPVKAAKSPRKVSELGSNSAHDELPPLTSESPKLSPSQPHSHTTTHAASFAGTPAQAPVQTDGAGASAAGTEGPKPTDAGSYAAAQPTTTPDEPKASLETKPAVEVLPVQQTVVVPAAIMQSMAASIPPAISQELELQRLSALHSLGLLEGEDHPRLNKITQMTARLLGRSCCVLSLVDSDKVFWKSVACSTAGLNIVKEEPRYESFCSWVVQDETGRGVTILDAKSDPRCTHMKVKQGLEFYAGVPILLGGKYKIGALSIQGPPSGQVSVIDMNILHEMSLWAAGELDTIIQQKSLCDLDKLLHARDKLGQYANSARSTEKELDSRLLEKSLGVVRTALNAHCVLLLKLSPEPKGFQSLLQAYSITSAGSKASTLPLGEDMFKELCTLTLKKEGDGAPLLLENLKTGAVTKDVDHYLNKKINKCLSELLWSSTGPTAVLAAFFEGNYRTITPEELLFIKGVVPSLSAILEQLELKESFYQAAALFKNIGNALKKNPVPFGKQTGLAPCVMVIEPKMMAVKGYAKLGSMLNLQGSQRDLTTVEKPPAPPSEPKGLAQAQQLAQKDPTSPSEHTLSLSKKILEISPLECYEVMQDFTQILDNLAEKFALKKSKRFGQQFFLFANYGPETGTYFNAAALAHELFFSLDTYNQNKRRSIKAQVGIHTDFVPADIAGDNAALKDHIMSVANGAYQLESRADSILASETFYHQTKDHCSYESAAPMVIRGQGAFATYRLIGITEAPAPTNPDPVKENGLNDKGSLVVSKVPPSLAVEITSPTDAGTTPVKPTPAASTPTRKAKCIIM